MSSQYYRFLLHFGRIRSFYNINNNLSLTACILILETTKHNYFHHPLTTLPPTKSILKPFLTLFYIWIKLNFNEIRFFLFDTIAQTIWSYFISRKRIHFKNNILRDPKLDSGSDSVCFCFVTFIGLGRGCDLYLEICPC